MGEQLKEVFTGKVVNKRLTFNTGMDEFPRYVLEYLIDNYCEEATFDEDFELVKRRLRENFVHGAEAERIRSHIRENREHTIIANLEVRSWWRPRTSIGDLSARSTRASSTCPRTW